MSFWHPGMHSNLHSEKITYQMTRQSPIDNPAKHYELRHVATRDDSAPYLSEYYQTVTSETFVYNGRIRWGVVLKDLPSVPC